MLNFRIFSPVALFLLLAANTALAVPFERVAIMVFPQNEGAERLQHHAVNHLQTILMDNAITVLDRQKAEELKNGWQQLEDPTALITAEDFIENAEKYAIDGIVRIYLSVDALPSLADTYTATAQADLRFVTEEALSSSYVTEPMGVMGNPPSDGLTESAAGLNALQRAIDESAKEMGLTLIARTLPRSIKYSLVPVDAMPAQGQTFSRIETDRYEGKVQFFDESQKWEEPTCAAESPDGNLVAVGSWVTENFRGRTGRSWYSRLHILDLTAGQVPYIFDTWPQGRKPSGLRGTSKILGCMFLNSWRYVAAVTGNYIFLWDTERGLELFKHPLGFELDEDDEVQTLLVRQSEKSFLSVRAGDMESNFRVERQ